MNFFKKIFGQKASPEGKKEAEYAAQENKGPSSQDKKEEHDREHSGENQKPKNVCEFC